MVGESAGEGVGKWDEGGEPLWITKIVKVKCPLLMFAIKTKPSTIHSLILKSEQLTRTLQCL